MSARQSNRGQQWAVGLVGALVTLAMLLLGLWQMQVFENQGNRDATQRSTAAPVDLMPLIPPDGSVGDVYGRNVRVAGHYSPDESVVVVDRHGTRRYVTALLLDDGRALPIVRGTGDHATATPTGDVTLTGVFLPSEAAENDRSVGSGELTSVRLPALQQTWSQQLAPGFVTLNADEARAEQLTPAIVALPSKDGALRNFGYALQWWVFAAFAVTMTVIWIRTLGRRALADDADSVQATALDRSDDAAPGPESADGSDGPDR